MKIKNDKATTPNYLSLTHFAYVYHNYTLVSLALLSLRSSLSLSYTKKDNLPINSPHTYFSLKITKVLL